MTWWVIVNPGAGRRSDTVERARAALRGMDAIVNVSAAEADVAALVAAGAGAGHRRFIAVGGDGTVNLVVDALMRLAWTEPPVLGILPAGSGCDFVRTFAISQVLEEAVAHLRGDQTYLVDVGRVRGAAGERYFLNAAEAGLGAAVVERAARYPDRLGALRYKVAVWPTLVRFPRTEIELTADARSYTGPAMMVVFANGQFFGGGMNIAPKAILGDGKLDVQVFSGPKRDAIVLQPRITRGTHLTHRAVRRLSAGEITLRTEVPWPVEVDGEFYGNGDVTVDVVPAALRIKI